MEVALAERLRKLPPYLFADIRRKMADARERGIKAGLLRPITLWPFPEEAARNLGQKVKCMIVPEANLGQMIYEVERVASCSGPVVGVNRIGGVPIYPGEILRKIEEFA